MKKRVISIIIMLTFLLVTCVDATGSEPNQISMTLDEYLETSDEAWFLTGKKEYHVQAMMVSEEKSFHNDYEDNDFTVTDDGVTVVLKGTHDEVWKSILPNVISTYTKPDGNTIKESDFAEKDIYIDLVTIPAEDSNFAMYVPSDISVTVETAWGDVLHANLEGVSHGDGDYLVCCAGEDGNPDLSDVWVVNGVLFPENYDTGHRNVNNYHEISQEQAKQMMEHDDGLVPVITCGYGQIEDQVLDTAETQQNEVHVTVNGNDEYGNGTIDSPFATASAAAEASPGSRIIIHGGEYGPLEFGQECSGQEDSPTTITAAEGETVIIHAEDGAGISIENAHHILIKGLEIVDGTHGIVYTSTRESGEQPLNNIGIIDCTVHGVRGVHGICVYACNDMIPVTDLTIEGCEIYDCECGSSESLVINGNIDGFLIAGNSVHDNNNIGIDMIGFEGTAIHPDDNSTRNLYDEDFVRNGICRDNIIYNISTQGNPAYYEDGEYDPCAGGIYVDGGQNIEIYNNFIFNCDIGLEVATEHNPEDNELFRVSGIRVHDNVIADCGGWTGLCFGGYDSDRGFTQECEFDHNTLVDNSSHIGVQRSRDNTIYANLIIGGEIGVEFSEDCLTEDMINNISGNVCAEIEDEESWDIEYGKIYDDRSEIAYGFCSLIRDIGSSYIPDENMMEIYETQMKK